MGPPNGSDDASRAWKATLELIGWGGRRPPRFPWVASQLDLAPKQLGVIMRLLPGEEMPMGAIAESLYCDASYVTDLTDKLEARGLLERRPSTEDRRVKLIALTAAGLELREKATKLMHKPPEEFSRLSEAELRQLADLLEKTLDS